MLNLYNFIKIYVSQRLIHFQYKINVKDASNNQILQQKFKIVIYAVFMV